MSPVELPPNYDETRIQRFVQLWHGAHGEDTTAHTFFRELCSLLAVEEPPRGQPDESYRFEKRIEVPKGMTLRKQRADVYRRGMFVWENKSLHRDLSGGRSHRWLEQMREAYEQAKRYAKFLADGEPERKRPPLLVVCDIGSEIWIWNTFIAPEYGTFEDREEILIEDLARPRVFQRLQWTLSEPQRLNPHRESGRVTLAIARSLGLLVASLEARLRRDIQEDDLSERIARFTMACIFTLFAEDIGLLPDRSFREALSGRWQAHPERFVPEAKARWKLMETGGEDKRLGRIRRFNGGLFHRTPVLDLHADELRQLAEAARYDWSEVEPSIFGSLLEQSLRAHERARLGAHFTPREYIERVVQPTIIEPLRSEWQIAHAEAVDLARQAVTANEKNKLPEARKLRKRAKALCYAFLGRLREVRVLDPACGTGNFLYVSMDLIKRLEKEVLVALRDLGEAMEQLTAVLVQPDQFFGIEKKPWSKEIAELVLWIGFLQWWRRERGRADPPEPVLRSYGNIEVGDAILDYDAEEQVLDGRGRPAVVTRQGKPGKGSRATLKQYVGSRPTDWPEVDFIVSNPPFIGNKRMRELVGDGYAEAVREAYGTGDDALSGDVDYVVYWWHKAALRLRDPSSRLRRFGFITTNSIRQRQSGAVIRHHLGKGITLQFACPDHPWVDPSEELGSAAVRISMTVARRTDEAGVREIRFIEDLDSKRTSRTVGTRSRARGRGAKLQEDGAFEVRLRETRGQRINADLTVGADLTDARPLAANANLCFQGMNLVGEGFRLSPAEVTQLLGSRRKRPVALKRYVKGHDLKEAPNPRYVIDFFGLDEGQAQKSAPELFNHLVQTIKPLRVRNSRENYARLWWLFGEPRPGLRCAVSGLERYIATPETSAHRFFIMLDAEIIPDHQIYVIACADDFVHGVLSSRAHTEWALRAGGSNGVGNDSRWTSTATFLPFPFPDPSPAKRRKIAEIMSRLEDTRKEVLEKFEEASLTEIYNIVEVLRVIDRDGEGSSDWSDEQRKKAKKWRCDTIRYLHDELDRAVLLTYGFSPDIDTDDMLQGLLALNHERAIGESAGVIRWLRSEYQSPLTRREALATSIAVVDPAVSRGTQWQWPAGKERDVIRRQVAMIREVLAAAGRPLTIDEIVASFSKPSNVRVMPQIRRHLEILEAIGAFLRQDTARGDVWSLGD